MGDVMREILLVYIAVQGNFKHSPIYSVFTPKNWLRL